MTVKEMSLLAGEIGYTHFSIFSDSSFEHTVVCEKPLDYLLTTRFINEKVLDYREMGSDGMFFFDMYIKRS